MRRHGFEQYLATRDSQLKNTLGRKAKKLLAAGTIEIVTQPEDVDAAMDALRRRVRQQLEAG